MDHLFDIAACLGTGLDEHDVQFFGSLLSFLDRDLPAGKSSQTQHLGLIYSALTCCFKQLFCSFNEQNLHVEDCS